jgi:acetyltransferase
MAAPDDPAARTMLSLPDGEQVILRPIRPDDAPRLQALAPRLSSQTVRFRFFGVRRELYPEEAERLAAVDYRDRMAVVAERQGADGPEVIGVARYDRDPARPETAEFALLVEDRLQRRGLGRALLGQLVAAARANGIQRLVGDVLRENRPMLEFIGRAGFPVTLETRGAEVHFTWEIAPPP